MRALCEVLKSLQDWAKICPHQRCFSEESSLNFLARPSAPRTSPSPVRGFDGQGQAYTKVLPPMGLWSSETSEETSLMFLGDVSLELCNRHSETSKMFQSKRRAAGESLIPRGPPSSSRTALPGNALGDPAGVPRRLPHAWGLAICNAPT